MSFVSLTIMSPKCLFFKNKLHCEKFKNFWLKEYILELLIYFIQKLVCLYSFIVGYFIKLILVIFHVMSAWVDIISTSLWMFHLSIGTKIMIPLIILFYFCGIDWIKCINTDTYLLIFKMVNLLVLETGLSQ